MKNKEAKESLILFNIQSFVECFGWKSDEFKGAKSPEAKKVMQIIKKSSFYSGKTVSADILPVWRRLYYDMIEKHETYNVTFANEDGTELGPFKCTIEKLDKA